MNQVRSAVSVHERTASSVEPLPQEFVRRLRQQDREAFSCLVQKLQTPLKRFIRSLGGDVHLDDILQETWLAAYRGFPGFEGRASVKTWLFTIARHEAHKLLRKNSATHPVGEQQDPDADAAASWLDQQFSQDGQWRDELRTSDLASPEALLQADQLQDCIDHTLQCMKPAQVTVLMLREQEQMSIPQISHVTGLNDSHVRVLLHRARLHLMREIIHYHHSGECNACKSGQYSMPALMMDTHRQYRPV